jgi:hypothetical protein
VWAVLDLLISHHTNGIRFTELDRERLKHPSADGGASRCVWWVVGWIPLLAAISLVPPLRYRRIYDQPAVKGTMRHLGYQAVGVLAFSLYIGIEVSVLHAVKRAGGGAGSIFILTFVFSVLFWWCSAYFLLYRRLGWRQLLPAGVATGFCITGLGVFSALLFSDQITSGDQSYGPAGVVIALISYLVGYGVCLHLGAVFGRMWNDWRSAKRLASQSTGQSFGA